MVDFTVIATALITGTVGVAAAAIGSFGAMRVGMIETRRQHWAYEQTRRSERQAAYQVAADLLGQWGWRASYDKAFDIMRDFTLPFVSASLRVRIYGSSASVAAMDEIQESLDLLNRAETDQERDAAWAAISVGTDHFVAAARADVGPGPEARLPTVKFRAGAGPPTDTGGPQQS